MCECVCGEHVCVCVCVCVRVEVRVVVSCGRERICECDCECGCVRTYRIALKSEIVNSLSSIIETQVLFVYTHSCTNIHTHIPIYT